MTPEQEEKILDNGRLVEELYTPIFKEVVKGIEDRLTIQWQQSKTPIEREEIWQQQKALQTILAELKTLLLQARLLQLQKLQKPNQ